MKKVELVFPPFSNPTFVPYQLMELRGYCEARGFAGDIVVADWNTALFNCTVMASDPDGLALGSLQAFLHFPTYIHQANAVIERWYAYARSEQPHLLSYLQDRGGVPASVQTLVSALNTGEADCVGFSLTFHQKEEYSQFFFTLAAAKYLKATGFTGRVVVGGALVNHLDMAAVLGRFPFFDAVFFKEPEESFYLFLSGTDSVLPNVWRPGQPPVQFENNVCRKITPDIRLDDLAPDYWNPVPVISLQYKRGCSWNQCRFCGQNASYFGYEKQKELTPFFSKIKTCQDRGISFFYISDQMLNPRDLIRICDMIEKLSIVIYWTFMAMPGVVFSAELLSRLRRCGCVWITWGIESGSAHMLKRINKPVRLQAARETVIQSHLAGIKNVLLMMYALPGETREDFQATLDFLEEMAPYYYDHSMSPFYLTQGSEMVRDPDRCGIEVGPNIPLYEDPEVCIPSPLYVYEMAGCELTPDEYQVMLPARKTTIPFAEHMLIYSACLQHW